jgi:hypothetical protein
VNWDMQRAYLPVFVYKVTEECRLQAPEIKLYEILINEKYSLHYFGTRHHNPEEETASASLQV